MNSRQDLDLKVFFDKEFFYVGEPIKGNLILKTQKPSIIEKIVVEIKVIQQWKLSDVYNNNFNNTIANCELDLNKVSQLSNVQGCYIMPGGENIIPFKIKLIKNLDPCFEYPLGDIYSYLSFSPSQQYPPLRRLPWGVFPLHCHRT